jgi:hypothetical protein
MTPTTTTTMTVTDPERTSKKTPLEIVSLSREKERVSSRIGITEDEVREYHNSTGWE